MQIFTIYIYISSSSSAKSGLKRKEEERRSKRLEEGYSNNQFGRVGDGFKR